MPCLLSAMLYIKTSQYNTNASGPAACSMHRACMRIRLLYAGGFIRHQRPIGATQVVCACILWVTSLTVSVNSRLRAVRGIAGADQNYEYHLSMLRYLAAAKRVPEA